MSDEIVHPDGAVVSNIDGEIRSTNPNYGVPDSVTAAANDSLGVILPDPRSRKIAYACYAGASLIVSNIAVAFGAINTPAPTWLVIALAIVGNLATPFAGLAIANAKGGK